MIGFNPNLQSMAMLGSLVIYMEDQRNWERKTERELKVKKPTIRCSDESFKPISKAIMFHTWVTLRLT